MFKMLFLVIITELRLESVTKVEVDPKQKRLDGAPSFPGDTNVCFCSPLVIFVSQTYLSGIWMTEIFTKLNAKVPQQT